jgi:ABC-type amino acid transport substrate-binding protein
VAAAWFGAALASPLARADETRRLVVFYDPDANHKAILNITAWFNKFLDDSKLGLSFQPVQGRADFEKMLGKKEVAFAIVSSRYLREHKDGGLVPLLVPSAAGNTRFEKLLLDKGQGQKGQLEGKRVAATATSADPKQAAQAILATLGEAGLDVDGVIALPVAKDIDALLALSFGQVEAALVTANSLQVLRGINPKAVESFRLVFKTKGSLYPPLCAVDGRADKTEREAFARVVQAMAKHAEGRKAMQTLGFDTWVPFAPEMLDK